MAEETPSKNGGAWRFVITPQTIISLVNMVMIFVSVTGLWFQMRSDVDNAKQLVFELKTSLLKLYDNQQASNERLARVEALISVVVAQERRTPLPPTLPVFPPQ